MFFLAQVELQYCDTEACIELSNIVPCTYCINLSARCSGFYTFHAQASLPIGHALQGKKGASNAPAPAPAAAPMEDPAAAAAAFLAQIGAGGGADDVKKDNKKKKKKKKVRKLLLRFSSIAYSILPARLGS